MTATHIYINAQGVPCAPTQIVLDICHRGYDPSYVTVINEVKACCIPIRKEDRYLVWPLLPKKFLNSDRDRFYEVERYEFEMEEIIGPGWMPTYNNPDNHNLDEPAEPMKIARIIGSIEPKAGPSKELYNIKPLEWIEYKKHDGELYTMDAKGLNESWYVVHNGLVGFPIYYNGQHIGGDFKSIEEAKTYAQSHFNDRIKQCLIKES